MHGNIIRSKLFRPPNAVPDHGIDLGGKHANAVREALRRTEEKCPLPRLRMHRPRGEAPPQPKPTPTPQTLLSEAPFGCLGRIQHACARRYGITVDFLISPCRRHLFVRPRQIAMHLACTMTSYSTTAIGRRFCRDHTTVMHADRKIARLIETDATLAAEIEEIKRDISNSLGVQPPRLVVELGSAEATHGAMPNMSKRLMEAGYGRTARGYGQR